MSNRSAPRGSLTVQDVRTVPVHIYTLSDASGVRYVGKTSEPWNRLSNHRAKGSVRVKQWISETEAAGDLVRFEVVLTVEPGEDAAAAEAATIAHYRNQGARLLNGLRGKRKPMPNKGSLALLALDMTQSDIARRLGVGQPLICQWATGYVRPDSLSRARLEDEFGIYWRLWDQSADTAQGAAA